MTALGARSFTGGAPSTTLSSGCGATDLTLAINTIVTTNWPNLSIGPFIATINRGEADEEKILVTAMTATQFTVIRGEDNGPAGQSHAPGATVTHTNDAASTLDVNRHVYDTTRNDHTQYQLALSAGYGIAGLGSETPAVDLTVVESYISGNVVLVTGGTVTNICQVSLGAGTWDITARASLLNSSASTHAIAEICIGPNSTSSSGAYAADQVDLAAVTTNGGYVGHSELRRVITLGSPTTVHFMGIATGAAVSAQWETGVFGTAVDNISGITAVRIA